MHCNCFSPECLDGCLGGGVDTEAGPGVGSGGGGHLHQPAPALLQQRQHLRSIIVDSDNHIMTVFALAVMEYAVGISKFGKNPKTLLVHQY